MAENSFGRHEWVYLGDGVYYRIECDDIILITYDGISISNTIDLEPLMIRRLAKVTGDA